MYQIRTWITIQIICVKCGTIYFESQYFQFSDEILLYALLEVCCGPSGLLYNVLHALPACFCDGDEAGGGGVVGYVVGYATSSSLEQNIILQYKFGKTLQNGFWQSLQMPYYVCTGLSFFIFHLASNKLSFLRIFPQGQ